MTDRKLENGIICGWWNVVVEILNDSIITKKDDSYQLRGDPERNYLFINNYEFLETMKNDVISEIKTFADIRLSSQLFDDTLQKSIIDELLVFRKAARTYGETVQGVVARICSTYLRPHIHLDAGNKLTMDGAYLSTSVHKYGSIDKVMTIRRTKVERCIDTEKYFDYIEIEVGYISSFSKDEIKTYISDHKVDISMFLYDKIFIAIMRKRGLWDRVIDILDIMRFMKLDRIQVTSENLVVFLFGFKVLGKG